MSWSTSSIATRAPARSSAKAITRPSPGLLPAPVTIATFPWRLAGSLTGRILHPCMPVRGLVFDLFGTLVEDADPAIYPRMAEVLGVPLEVFRAGWSRYYPARETGKMTFAEAIVAMGFERPAAVKAAKIRAAEIIRSLGAVMPGAEALLETLPLPFTLLSNASVEVPAAWPGCPLA